MYSRDNQLQHGFLTKRKPDSGQLIGIYNPSSMSCTADFIMLILTHCCFGCICLKHSLSYLFECPRLLALVLVYDTSQFPPAAQHCAVADGCFSREIWKLFFPTTNMIALTGIQTPCLLSISQSSSTRSIYSKSSCFPQVTRSVRRTSSSISAVPVPSHNERRPCECHDLFEEIVPYVEAWRWQRETVDRISASLVRGEEPPNSVVLLQHPPVYTMGTRSSDAYLRFDKDHPPFELHRTERGGEVTYHGPGQLVMYPIVNLRHQKMDLHWYLRMLEEVIIRALWSSCSLRASRIDGLTGVWVGDLKVAAIGVRVSRWITYHGLALNVNTDLAPFQNIVPCGIVDRPVGSIKQLLHAAHLSCAQGVQTSKPFESDANHKLLEDATILDRVHQSLLLEFAEIFQMDLVAPMNKGPQKYQSRITRK